MKIRGDTAYIMYQITVISPKNQKFKSNATTVSIRLHSRNCCNKVFLEKKRLMVTKLDFTFPIEGFESFV
jgi:hypothetical protein